MVACVKYFDENYRKASVSVGVFPSVMFFFFSALALRHGWFGFEIDVGKRGMIGCWLLAMVVAQLGLIIIYKNVFKRSSASRAA